MTRARKEFNASLKVSLQLKKHIWVLFEPVNSALGAMPTNEQSEACVSFFVMANSCAAFRWLDESDSLRSAVECAFKWFFNTLEEHCVPELWKSLRWAASAYAHYLWEHAASWLAFTKAGTQGQSEWEWEMCMLTPSDETLLQLCVYMGTFLCAWLSLYGDLRVCMCVCVHTCLLSILSSKISYIDCLLLKRTAKSLPIFCSSKLVSSLLYIWKQIYRTRLWSPLYFIRSPFSYAELKLQFVLTESWLFKILI